MSAAALFHVDAAPAHTQEAAPMGEAAALICRVVDALLREDHLGIQSAGRLVHEPNNDRRAWPWWTAPLPGERVLRLPVRPDGFLAEHRLAEPFVLVEDATGSVAAAETIDVILAVLAPLNDAEAEPGDGQCLHPGRCRRRQGPGTAGKFASNPLWQRLQGDVMNVDDATFLASVSIQGAHAVITDLAKHYGVDPHLP